MELTLEVPMSARFLPFSLLLFSQTIPAHADLKLTIRRGTQRETLYIQGRKSRTEIGDAFGPQVIWIFNGDRQIQYGLDPATHAYNVHAIEPWKPNPLLRARESGKTIDIYRDYVDTGERRWMFGHLARHVILSERRVPEPGSCAASAGEGESRMKKDGWYIDLPAAQPQGRGYGHFLGSTECANGAVDRIEIHTTGHCENGFPLLDVSTSSQWHGLMRNKVVEWDESPLDPKVFLPPADFHEVPSLPNQRPNTILNNLRYRLSWWVSAAEELLD
jgi:hypothetical protein